MLRECAHKIDSIKRTFIHPWSALTPEGQQIRRWIIKIRSLSTRCLSCFDKSMVLYRARFISRPRLTNFSLSHFLSLYSSSYSFVAFSLFHCYLPLHSARFYLYFSGIALQPPFASVVLSLKHQVLQYRRSRKVPFLSFSYAFLYISFLLIFLILLAFDLLSLEPDPPAPVAIPSIDEIVLLPPSVSALPGGVAVKRIELVSRKHSPVADSDKLKDFANDIHFKIYKCLQKVTGGSRTLTAPVVEPNLSFHYNELVQKNGANNCGSYIGPLVQPFTQAGPTSNFVEPSKQINVYFRDNFFFNLIFLFYC